MNGGEVVGGLRVALQRQAGAGPERREVGGQRAPVRVRQRGKQDLGKGGGGEDQHGGREQAAVTGGAVGGEPGGLGEPARGGARAAGPDGGKSGGTGCPGGNRARSKSVHRLPFVAACAVTYP